MANPFDEFDSHSASTEGNPFDSFDDGSEKQKGWMKTIGQSLGGTAETAASLVAPLPSQIVGGIRGVGALLSGQGIDAANEVLNSTMKSNFGAGAYVPYSEKGKQYSEATGEFLNKPVEWAGDAGEFVGGDLGRLTGEVGMGTAMALIDPLIGLKGTQAMLKRAGKPSITKPAPLSELHAELNKETAPVLEKGQQGNLFDQFDTQGHAEPYNAGQAGVTEPIAPNRQRAQMELQLEHPETQMVTPEGVAFPKEQAESILHARDVGQDRMMAELDAGVKPEPVKPLTEQGNLFPEQTNQHRAFSDLRVDDGKGGERPLTRPEFESTVKNLVKEPSTRFPEVDMDAAFKSYQESLNNKQAGLFDIDSRKAAFDTAPAVVRVEDALAKQRDAISSLRDDIRVGKVQPHALIEAMSKLKALEDRASIVKANTSTKLEAAMPTAIKNISTIGPDGFMTGNTPARSFNKNTRKQGGGLFMGEQARKQLLSVDKRFKDLMPDTLTDEQFLSTHSATPDVHQNALQKALNMGTKGGVYQTMKTHNPLIKRVVDRFRLADNQAKASIQHIVHDKMEPLARALNDKEKADAWAAVMIAQDAKHPLTPELMAKYGFNDKQIKWATTHIEVMDKMYDRLVSSMKAAGLEPVSKQVAYAAAKASGDFRRLVLDANGDVKHIITADTKLQLDKDTAKYKKLFPTDKVGEQQYFGGQAKGGSTRAGMSDGFSQMLNFLTEHDPKMKEYVDRVNMQASTDAFNYMNMKTHTMAKKGITGMEGNKISLDSLTPDKAQAEKMAIQNAREGMRAQTRYVENMLKWSELSEAVNDTKAVLSPDSGLNMPNAKEYLGNYIDTALGRNPTELGRALDHVSSAAGKALGVGTAVPHHIMGLAKQTTNAILLGLSPMFLLTNAVQPLRAMPGMAAWLRDMGIKKDFDFATGYSYMGRAAADMMKEAAGKKLSPVMEGALKYAEDHHVYSSDLFETGGDVVNTARLKANKVTQMGAARVERETRKVMFLSFTKMLAENDLKGNALYEASHKLTDMAMNNYSHQEAPMAYNALGGTGRLAYNLMSYKHNELSRLSMLARDVKVEKSTVPLLTEMAAQVAFAGIKGTILYHEADQLVRYISNKMGSPTSITKMMLDAKIPDAVSHGLFAKAGVDMSGRLGMNILPGSAIDAVMPGAGKLVDIGAAGVELARNPSEFNAKNLALTAAPAGVAGPIDRAWFSPNDAQGNELAFNKNKVQATAIRNDADKAWKTIGATGINEAQQKSASYENAQIKLAYEEKRKTVLNDMGKAFFTSGRIPAPLVEKFVKYEGDPSSLDKQLTTMAIEQQIPQWKVQMLKSAASNSISAVKDLQRRTK